jgi:peptidyl-prolyl cis-trans isomerase B (cyclophilin B)
MRTRIPSLLLVLAAALALAALAGCGSSKKSDSAGGAISTPATTDTAASTPDTTASTSTTSQSGPCKSVSQPNPKGAQDLHKPTLKLDPSKQWTATMVTNCGTFVIELDVKRAPKTSASFASLSEKGFYDDLIFHRIAPGFVIQGGDPQGDGSGGPGYQVVEAPPKSLKYTQGVVAMAKTGTDPPGASGSQFFVVTAPDAQLPPEYALLGKVVKGYKVVETIANLPLQSNDPSGSPPVDPVVISKVMIKGS